MKKFPLPNVLKQFSAVFEQNGFKLYVVGGAVRDFLLGLKNQDYDFCTDALPEQVVKMFKYTIPTGIKHGTITVLFKDQSFEVTTFRTESDYSDSRHPDKIEFVRTLEEDLSRRDFTINAFACDCKDGTIIDLFDGEKDLKNKTIKAIGNPLERFKEDALRLMRMARFCAKLNFMPEHNTFEAAKILCKNIKNVSEERICDELFKTLSSDNPVLGLRIMEDCNLLSEIIPELTECRNINQNKVNVNNVLDHIYLTVNAASKHNYNLNVRLAALLHDIGKVQTMTVNQYNVMRFVNHDIKSALLANDILRRLKCSNDLIQKVVLLVKNHMVKYQSNWTDGAVKRFINRIGQDNINELFELQWCDQIASEGKSKVDEYDELIQRIKKASKDPLTVKDLKVNGEELYKAGIPKDKNMGLILNQLLEMVLDYPSLNNKKTLIEQSLILYNNIQHNGQ